MAFRFASPTVDELPKRLLHSDQPPISEFINTALDAGSRHVEFTVNMCPQDYRKTTIQIREDDQIAKNVVHFIVHSIVHQNHRDSLTMVERLQRTHLAFLTAVHSSHSIVVTELLTVIASLIGQMNLLSLQTHMDKTVARTENIFPGRSTR